MKAPDTIASESPTTLFETPIFQLPINLHSIPSIGFKNVARDRTRSGDPIARILRAFEIRTAGRKDTKSHSVALPFLLGVGWDPRFREGRVAAVWSYFSENWEGRGLAVGSLVGAVISYLDRNGRTNWTLTDCLLCVAIALLPCHN